MTVGTEQQQDLTNVVDEEQMDFKDSNTLVEAANERKRRLQQMRLQIEQKGNEEEGHEPSSKISKLTFRSYEPQSDIAEKRDNTDLFAVEKEIAEQLADTEDAAVVEQIDITTLAPRKVDWDLKRDVAERLKKLELLKERAIAHLIRERLREGKTELADAVSSGAYSELQTDD